MAGSPDVFNCNPEVSSLHFVRIKFCIKVLFSIMKVLYDVMAANLERSRTLGFRGIEGFTFRSILEIDKNLLCLLGRSLGRDIGWQLDRLDQSM
jgi:hypothetical protein